MPIHDWTRVPSGLFHDFHQVWSVNLRNALNAGLMPGGYYAFVEQRVDGPEPDVIAVETGGKNKAKPDPSRGGTAVLDVPRTRLAQTIVSDAARYAKKANRLTVRHYLGDVVAVIEIVSPGNKDSKNAFKSFVEKAVAYLNAGIHLLVVDLFPPTPRDPQGLHKAVLDQYGDAAFEPPADKRLTFVGYQAAPSMTAYIEPVAVGDALPDMPLFLDGGYHVPVPLEATYRETWAVCPEPIRELVDSAAGG